MVGHDEVSKMLTKLQEIMTPTEYADLLDCGDIDNICGTMIISEGGFPVTLLDLKNGYNGGDETEALKELVCEQLADGLVINDLAYVFLKGEQVNMKIDISFSPME